MSRLMILLKPNNQSGAIAILTAIMLTMFIGFVALSVDTGHLVVTKNELQNAADAGALAGANALFNDDGTALQLGEIFDSEGTQIAVHGCNQIAYDTALSNFSEKKAVEVFWEPDQNAGSDVERGHWSFGMGDDLDRGFEPSDNTDITDLIGKTIEELDQDPNFINAVRVTTRRENHPISSFFARIWGKDSFQQQATAVAYIGFAGKFAEGELEIPMALCREVFYPDGATDPVCDEDAVLYQKAETAMWTNLLQSDDPSANCPTTNDPNITDVVEGGNPGDIYVGVDMGVTYGITSVLPDLIEKWEAETIVNEDPVERKVWRKTFPVIDCFDAETESEETTCAKLVGGVEIEILWIIETKFKLKSEYDKAPYKYYEANYDPDDPAPSLKWESDITDNETRMTAFREYLGLPELGEDGKELDKRIFFSTNCGVASPAGGPGGINTGVLAERSVLVR